MQQIGAGASWSGPVNRDIGVRLLAEDAGHANSHGWSKHHPAAPLYTGDDVDQAPGERVIIRSMPES